VNRRRNTTVLEEELDQSLNEGDEIVLGREGRDISATILGALLWPTMSGIVGG
jgi:hypothetical protein